MKKNEIKAVNVTVEVVTKVAEKNRGFLPMAGWHQNYNDFTLEDGRTGTATYINGTVTIIIEGKVSHSIDIKPMIQLIAEGGPHGEAEE